MIMKGVTEMSPETKRTVRRLDLSRGVLILTLVLYIAVALIINSSYLTVDRLMRLRSNVICALSENSHRSHGLDADDTVDVVAFQDGYAVLTRNGLTVRGSAGNEYSSHTLHYTSPCIKAGKTSLLCFDRAGSDWSLYNSFSRLCSSDPDVSDAIINAAVSEDGYFAVATEREDAKGCVTVYNDEGLALTRWNSKNYILDLFFTDRNVLTVVSLQPDREKTNTVFTSYHFKDGEVISSVTAPDTFPLSLAQKEDGSIEMLTDTGALRWDSEKMQSVHIYPEPSPGICFQGSDATMISYHTVAGGVSVAAFKNDGTMLFTVSFPEVVSLACGGDLYFVLTPSTLHVLDSSGKKLETRSVVASRILVSEEISLLRKNTGVEILDLSAFY